MIALAICSSIALLVYGAARLDGISQDIEVIDYTAYTGTIERVLL